MYRSALMMAIIPSMKCASTTPLGERMWSLNKRYPESLFNQRVSFIRGLNMIEVSFGFVGMKALSR